MPFVEQDFEHPIYEEEKREPNKLIVIATEGANTEKEYFQSVKANVGVKSILSLEILPTLDGKSAPKYVQERLEFYREGDYNFQSENDEFWIVIDRDKGNSSKEQLEEVIKKCSEVGSSVSITNPCFEFWLLLHIADISKYNYEVLLENERVNKNKRFIEKELSENLNGYSKSAGKLLNHSFINIDNIEKAIEQESNFENEPYKIIDSLGSNVGSLVKSIIYGDE